MLLFKNSFLGFIFIFCLTQQNLTAQEYKYWFFGKKASLVFAGKTQTDNLNPYDENVFLANICDKNGSLLFYSSGDKFWNNKHQKISNPHVMSDSIQSGYRNIIIPQPKKTNTYYSIAIQKGNLIAHTVINQNGNIKIIQRQVLATNIMHLSVAYHQNRKDLWLLTHNLKQNIFKAFLLNDKGINSKAVETKGGMTLEGRARAYGYYGSLKIAPDGKKVALVTHHMKRTELFTFDDATGKLGPLSKIYSQTHYPTSLEFSPDCSKLYISYTSVGFFEQFDISDTYYKTINASRYRIKLDNKFAPDDIQLGYDGKLYVARRDANYLTVVHKPNESREKCEAQNQGLVLAEGKESGNHLPLGIVNSFFESSDKIRIGVSFSKPILFQIAKSEIQEQYKPLLDEVLKFLKENPKTSIFISGHTDNVGNAQNNLTLSENRAKSVADYLQSKGIVQDRISYKGFGSTKPNASNETKEGKAKNRRIEFLIRKKR